jgi:hypothetical protein
MQSFPKSCICSILGFNIELAVPKAHNTTCKTEIVAKSTNLRLKKRIRTWNLPLHASNGSNDELNPLHVDFGQELDENDGDGAEIQIDRSWKKELGLFTNMVA